MPSPFLSNATTLFRRIATWISQNEVVIPWLLYFGLLALYLAFPTRNYYWDGVSFAQTIEDTKQLGTNLIHPNHLIYNVLGYYFYNVLLAVGFNIRAITALQVLNNIVSAMAAVVLYLTLKAMLRSLYLATFLTLLFALSATWWKFSTDADAYIISVLFLLLSFYFVLPDKRPQPYFVAFLFFLSMCFHQLAILFGPVVMVGLFFQEARVESKAKLSTGLKFGVTTILLTTTAYFSCFYLATDKLELRAFARWITYYSPDASFTFNIWDNLFYTLRGNARLFLSGRFSLITGLVRPSIVVLMVLLVVAFGTFVYLVVKNFHKPGSKSFRALMNNSRRRPLLMLAVVWTLIYLAFLFVWLPQNTFYRLFYLPALILLVGLFASARYDFVTYTPTYRLAVFTIAVGVANFLFQIYPYHHPDKFPPVRFALELSKEWPEGTSIYYAADNADKSLVRYFTPQTAWTRLANQTPDSEELKNIYAQGLTAWLETTAIDQLASTPEGSAWLSAHAKNDSKRELKDRGFRIEFLQVVP